MGYIIVGIVCLAVGAVGGIVCYWYFVTHRGKINPPTGISDIKK